VNIEPDINIDKMEMVTRSLAEVFHFVEELEQQVRDDQPPWASSINPSDLAVTDYSLVSQSESEMWD